MNLVFASPFLLGFLIALPLLWWLLRLTPPAPQKIVFPALALLRGLSVKEQTPARTPWWLLLLRLLIAALIIIACAEPTLNPRAVSTGRGALLIAVDNDWASARDWPARQNAVHDLIHEAEHDHRAVYLLPTAATPNGDALQVMGPFAAKAAYGEARRIAPQPWPSDWTEASKIIRELPPATFTDSVWLSSGLGGVDARIFYTALREAGAGRVLSDIPNPTYLLVPPHNEGDDVILSVLRSNTEPAASLDVSALTRDGRIVAHIPLHFVPGAPRVTSPLNLPFDIRNQVARFEIEGQHSAATTVLLDASWEHRPVGIVGDQAELDQHSLLSGLFYIDRALKPYADLHIDTLDALLKQKMAVLILTDKTELSDQQIPEITAWVKQGGVLVRFAGDRLSATQNPKESELLPVALLTGDRAMGGTLSWATPQTLHDFPATSPFRGLDVPKDVTINRQILAAPSADLAPHTWAALADGTPLVTSKNLGQGLTVLFHVPARSDWSNLPLSGLFVDMLRRIVDLSHGSIGDANFSSLPPLRMLNAFGDEQKPGVTAEPITENDFSHVTVGPQHPPGLYGTLTLNRALNLGTALTAPEILKDIQTENYHQKTEELDLETALLTVAALFLLLDFLISLCLRGVLKMRRHMTAALCCLAFVLPLHAHAAIGEKEAVMVTSKTTLAYIQTGDRQTDAISEAGLTGLAHMLQTRTSIDEIAVAGLDPNTDDLAFFPLIYWPLVPGEAPLSQEGVQRVNDYLHHGGMILFDSMTGDIPPHGFANRILAGIDLPPLTKLPQDHVLKRSFYLLDSFPGRYASEDFWLEPEDASSYDGVATVLSGTNGWAAAWAVDKSGRFLFPCTPGGEAQRERAYRFGINIVMYALTGNYKSDQLHAQALLQRMGK